MEKMAAPEGKYLASVKVGPKGQIVIPKEARELFGIQPGDTLLLLADVNRGIALQSLARRHPLFGGVLGGGEGKRKKPKPRGGGRLFFVLTGEIESDISKKSDTNNTMEEIP